MAGHGNDTIVPDFDEERGDHLNIFLERVETDPRALVVHLGDRLDSYNADYFERSVAKLTAAGYRRLVLACAELSYVSATGMASLARAGSALKELGGALGFAQVRPRVYEIFEMLGFAGAHPFAEEPAKVLPLLAPPPPPRPKVTALSVTCPGCGRRLLANRAGKFICSTCRTRMIVDEKGMARAC